MKTLIYSLLVFVAVSFCAVPAVNAVGACNVTDSQDKPILSPDCYGALLRVEIDRWIYTKISREGFVATDPEVATNGPQFYYTAPGCQGAPYLFSNARSEGFFFEPVHFVDETHFWYPMWKGQTVGGTAIGSWWNWTECLDTPGWFNDGQIFAPLALKPISDFKTYVPPFKLSR